MGNAPSKIPLKFGADPGILIQGDIWAQLGDARRAESGYAADIFMEDLLEKLLEPSVDTEGGGAPKCLAARGNKG